jgi:hypothetical protein
MGRMPAPPMCWCACIGLLAACQISCNMWAAQGSPHTAGTVSRARHRGAVVMGPGARAGDGAVWLRMCAATCQARAIHFASGSGHSAARLPC